MKKINLICKVVLLTLITFLAASCSFVGKTEEGFVKINLPQECSFSRYAVNINGITYFELSLKKGDNVLVENIRGTLGSSVELGYFASGEYTLEGSAYNSVGTKLAYKEQKIIIAPGLNSFVFSLESAPIFALWSKGDDGFIEEYYYSDIFGKKNIKSALDGISSITIDSNNDLWFAAIEGSTYLGKITDPLKNNNITISDFISEDSFPSGPLDKRSLGNVTESSIFSNDVFTAEDGRMFFFNYLRSYNPLEETSPILIDLTSFTRQNNVDYYIAHSKIVNNKGYAYVTYIYKVSDVYKFEIVSYEATLADNKISYSQKNIFIQDFFLSLGLNLPEKINNAEYTYNKGQFKVKDAYVIGNKLYVLINASNLYFAGYYGEYGQNTLQFSTGALVEFNINGESVTYSRTIGWSSNTRETNYKVPSEGGVSNEKLFVLAPIFDNRGFYGPKKILAIKPKKAWIADDGFILTDELELKGEKNVPRVIYKRRIVEVDLEEGTFSGVTALPEEIKLDNEKAKGSLY